MEANLNILLWIKYVERKEKERSVKVELGDDRYSSHVGMLLLVKPLKMDSAFIYTAVSSVPRKHLYRS